MRIPALRTIILPLGPFRDKIVTYSDAKSKGESIDPKGAVQAPSTQNATHEPGSHYKRKAGKADQVLYIADAQSFDDSHESAGNL